MIDFYLHGDLAEKYGRCYTLDINSPKEGIQALCHMIPSFKSTVQAGNFHLIVGSDDTSIDLNEEEVGLITLREIHLIPVIEGGGGGLLKVIIGAVLIAASFIPGFQFLLPMGVSMAMAGVASLISPQNKTSNSYVFNGEQVTLAQGSAIPLLYGEMYINLAPISASITDETSGTALENPTYGGTDGWAQADNTTANPFNQPSYT